MGHLGDDTWADLLAPLAGTSRMSLADTFERGDMCQVYCLQCHSQCLSQPLTWPRTGGRALPSCSWPELRAVQEPQYLDALAPLEPVDQNEGRAADDQLACAFDTTRPAHLGVSVLQLLARYSAGSSASASASSSAPLMPSVDADRKLTHLQR